MSLISELNNIHLKELKQLHNIDRPDLFDIMIRDDSLQHLLTIYSSVRSFLATQLMEYPVLGSVEITDCPSQSITPRYSLIVPHISIDRILIYIFCMIEGI